jgi:signal transduction histidine kinase
MLTGYGTLETAQQALRLGANDYIKKPFDTHQMLQLIRRYTKRTRNERHRHDAVHNVEQVNRQLMEEVTQMEQMASMGKVSAEFAHDLKNPLTIVMGYVELLAEQLQSVRYILGEHYGETEKYLEVIEQNVERCQELACMWQRMGKDKQHYPEAVDVAALVAEMKTGVEFLAVHDHANIEYDLGLDHGVMVWGCRVELMRAFHNIVTNAIHAVAEQRGTVCIQTREVADEIEFTVRDTGGGIHPDHLQTIFEPYFTTKKAGKGTGLGLAITKKIIETCKGRIEVDSAPGQGTVMTVRLPRMSSQSHSNAVANEIHTPLHYAAV